MNESEQCTNGHNEIRKALMYSLPSRSSDAGTDRYGCRHHPEDRYAAKSATPHDICRGCGTLFESGSDEVFEMPTEDDDEC